MPRPRSSTSPLLLLTALLLAADSAFADGAGSDQLSAAEERLLADREPPEELTPLGLTPCVSGMAGAYPCDHVDLAALIPLSTLNATNANDVWGWTHQESGREFALLGLNNGTAFVEITDPANPIYLGKLPTHSSNSTWRSIKVYADHAFIGSEAVDHGLQVFHLEELLDVVNPPVTFSESGHYNGYGRSHTTNLNEQTGFLYAAGSRQGTNTCSSGLHIVDVRVPDAPVFAGCVGNDGYTHETQCVVYHGPDVTYQGREICFNSNEDTLTIVDVTNKAAPVQLSRTGYAGSGYVHQGWLTEDHAHFLLDDELDESGNGHNTHTYIWSMADLDAPTIIGTYTGPTPAIDHNQYVKGNFVYQANYRAGLRILSLDQVASGVLTPVAFFDVYPTSNTASFNGSWSVFPYFNSGTVVVGGIEQGLFVLRPRLCDVPAAPGALSAVAAGDNRIDLSWGASSTPGVRYRVERSFGACPGGQFTPIADTLTTNSYADITASGSVTYSYRVTAQDSTGLCATPPTACDDATTTGICNAPPLFAGLDAVTSSGLAGCALDLTWSAADPNCGASTTYSVYRSTSAGFTPAPGNRFATGIAGTSFRDTAVSAGTIYYYVVRAVDATNGVEDGNTLIRSGTPDGPPVVGSFRTGAELGDPPLAATSGGTRHIGWEWTPTFAHTGVRSFGSGAFSNQCSVITTPPLVLAGVDNAELRFWTRYSTEAGADGGPVEISADGGSTWSVLALAGGYPGTFASGANQCGFAAGTPALTGSSGGAWLEHRADLSPWAGQTVAIRFTYSSDATGDLEGIFLDDLEVAGAMVIGSCTSGLIFSDGFEGGTTGAWTVVVP